MILGLLIVSGSPRRGLAAFGRDPSMYCSFFWQVFGGDFVLPAAVITLRATLTGCEGGLFDGSPRFSSSGRHEASQPHTNPSQPRVAVKCGRLCFELREEAASKKAPLESEGFGV